MPNHNHRPALLSQAEILSLRALARYDQTSAAAAKRMISERTLKNQLTSAYRKLGVRSRTGAFRTLGWLKVPRAGTPVRTIAERMPPRRISL